VRVPVPKDSAEPSAIATPPQKYLYEVPPAVPKKSPPALVESAYQYNMDDGASGDAEVILKTTS